MRQRVAELAAEVAALVRQPLPPDKFYLEFLRRVVSALGALGGTVWQAGGNEQRLAFEAGAWFEAGGVPLRDEFLGHQAEHQALLKAVCEQQNPQAWPAAETAGERRNPLPWAVLLAPVVCDGRVLGVVEVFQRPTVSANVRQGNLQFLARMAHLAVDFVKHQHLRQLAQREAWRNQFEAFLSRLHNGLDPALVAAVLAHEGASLLNCDRVSVLMRRGRKALAVSISGQEVIDPRANAVRWMERFVSLSGRLPQAQWFPAETNDLPPAVTQAAADYLKASGAKFIGLLPLIPEPSAPSANAPLGRFARSESQPVGWMVLEAFGDAAISSETRQQAARVAHHGAVALRNGREHRAIFLLPLWKMLGRLTSGFGSWRLCKWLLFFCLLLGAGYLLTVCQGDFTIEGRGTLEPVNRREVFARLDGVVREVRVRHGQQVKADEVLVVLDNEELKQRQTAWENERRRLQDELGSLQAMRTSSWTPEDRSLHASRIRNLQSTQQGLEERLTLLAQQMQELQITSPQSGEVITWDVENLLAARPVSRGHILLTVADSAGPWRLEVPLPENRLGHVSSASREATTAKEDLAVQFVLATDPGNVHEGTMTSLAGRAEVDESLGNTVLMTVDFDPKKLPDDLLRPGAAATVKIHCGRRALGYVWFHDVWEWFQQHVLFKIK